MRFYIKDNVVYKNKETIKNIDFEIFNPNLEEKNLYIGENGVGKTFHLHVVSSLAYLASDYEITPVQDYDRQRVIQDLADADIGDMFESRQADEELMIQHQTSYYGDEKKGNVSVPEDLSDIDEDVRKALEITAKMTQALDRHYCVKIGPQAKSFFNENNVIYYSNSQFPSNVTFFSKRASSFRAEDVDVGFWMLYRKLKECSHLKIKLWLNNSLGFNDCSKIIDVFKTQEWHDKIKYKYRKIFNFYNGELFSSLVKGNPILNKFVRWIEKNRGSFSPSYEYPFEKTNEDGRLSHLSVDSYLILIMLKEYLGNFNFEIYYDDIPLSKLNSGKRYLLTLDCLENVYNNGKNTVLIIDEPENSLHLSIQEKIAESKVNTLVATHSPAFAMSIMSRYPNEFKLHILKKDSDRFLVEEIVEEDYLDNNSLDSIAAEFFSYSPFLERWNELNGHINKSNLIDVNEFYRDLEKLK